MLPEIRKYIPPFSRYIEPFVGAGALLFNLQPEHAIISDYNQQLISIYRAIRENVEVVS